MSTEQQLWELSQQTANQTEGIVTAINWATRLADVNVGGVTYSMAWFGQAPWPADRVRVVFAGKKASCTPIYGSPMGAVQSVSSGRATVLGDDGETYVYPHVGTAPAVSARVRLDHAGRAVFGVYAAEPAGSTFVTPPAPPSAGISGGSAEFTAAWSGNWSGGAFQNEYATISSSRTAAYGYGTSIADTIPDSATIHRAELRLAKNWDNYPGEVIGFGLHSFDGRPGSLTNGSLSGTYTAAGGSTTINILGTVANALRDGSARGIGFYSSAAGPYGWREFDRAPASGRIYMEWS